MQGIQRKRLEPGTMAERYRLTRYQFTGTLREIRQKLLEIKDSDQQADNQRSQGLNGPGCGCLLLWLGLLALLLGASEGNWLLASLPVLIMLRGAWMLFSGLAKNVKNSEFDLQNMRYEVPLELLDSIAVDLSDSKPMSLMLDFSPSESQPFVTGVDFGKTKFRHPWLELSGSTVEGHRLKLEITRRSASERVQKTKRTVLRVRYADHVTVLVRPPVGQVLSEGIIDPPNTTRLRSVTGKLGSAGALIKAKGLACRAANSEFALRGPDLVALLLAAFRALSKLGP